MTKLQMTPKLEAALLAWHLWFLHRARWEREEIELSKAIAAASVKPPFHEALQEELGDEWTVMDAKLDADGECLVVHNSGTEFYVRPTLGPAKVAAALRVLAGEGE